MTEPAQPLFLAIDQGTHASRALVIDAAGSIVAAGAKDVALARPQADWAEQDGDEVVASVFEAAAQAVAALGSDRALLAAAGLASQRSSAVCWDRRDGRPLSPIFSWQDRRAHAWVRSLEARHGEAVHRATGLFLSPHYGASKLRWALDHLPAVREARDKGTLCWGPMASFLAFRLLRERPFLADPQCAARTQLWNLETRNWDAQLLRLFGLPQGFLPMSTKTCRLWGTFAHLPPSIEADVCRRLGLEPAPVSSQVIQRDRHAELLSALAICGASLEKFALEIRGLQKTEIGEVEEPFAKGQKGSSAMPHKRNPIGCEQICGLARVVRANAMAALENVALWHERDISHSSVERVILPDSFVALDHMLRRFTRIVSGMVVYPERMLENLGRSRGVVFSGSVLLELARRGVSREQAYEWVQRNAMRAFHEQTDFKDLLLADADIVNVLPRAEIERAFNLDDQLRNVDAIFARVFQEVTV